MQMVEKGMDSKRTMKMIWFRMAKDGRDIPVYDRKTYKKARYKRASERLAPGYWKSCVTRGISVQETAEMFFGKEFIEENIQR